MLDGYFGPGMVTTEEQRKRLLAVQAAVEIARSSASSAAGDSSAGKMYQDLNFASEHIGKLADAIQDALEPEEE